MTRRAPKNPHLKTLEHALAAQFGWQPGGALRDAIVGSAGRYMSMASGPMAVRAPRITASR